MNRKIVKILDQLSGPDVSVRDGLVKLMLLFEWDGQGRLDSRTAELFKDEELFSEPLANSDALDLISALRAMLLQTNLEPETLNGIIWALSKCHREQVFVIFCELIERSKDLKTLYDGTDILESLCFFLEDPVFREKHLPEIHRIITKLKAEFSSEGQPPPVSRLLLLAQGTH